MPRREASPQDTGGAVSAEPVAAGIHPVIGGTKTSPHAASPVANSPNDLTRARSAGTVFGIVAFSIWEVVVLVQRGTAGLWRDFVAPDLAEALDGGAETVRLL